MPSHSLAQFDPPSVEDFTRVVRFRRFGTTEDILTDPHRNPILDEECGVLDFGCKNRKRRAQERENIISSVKGTYQPTSTDAGPSFALYVGLSIMVLGGVSLALLWPEKD